LAELEREISQLKSGPQGFSVRVVSDKTVDENSTVTFDMVQYNTGGLKAGSGEFFCSKAGLYIFQLQARGSFDLVMVKNDMDKGSVHTDLPSDSTILHLQQGDVIKVVASKKSLLHSCKFSGARLA